MSVFGDLYHPRVHLLVAFLLHVSYRLSCPRCIFSGSRGEVCTLEPLRVAAYPGHPLAEHSILALATISKVSGRVGMT